MSPRADIRMQAAEIDRFLGSQHRAVVVAGGGDDAPLGTWARFRHRGGTTRFTLPEGDPVVAALADDDRACCVVDRFPSYYEIVGVMLHGRAVREPGADPGEAGYHLVVEKVVSFDFGKLRGE